MAKFINIPSLEGPKYINIEDIASVENINSSTIVTLSVKKNKDENVRFISLLSWADLTAEIFKTQISPTLLL